MTAFFLSLSFEKYKIKAISIFCTFNFYLFFDVSKIFPWYSTLIKKNIIKYYVLFLFAELMYFMKYAVT